MNNNSNLKFTDILTCYFNLVMLCSDTPYLYFTNIYHILYIYILYVFNSLSWTLKHRAL